MKQKPDLSFWKIWNLSFGFFGVQIAYALQSANISRIFTTLGADPHNLSYFWIIPPLLGMIAQPIVGLLSDKTWMTMKFGQKTLVIGRRIPYLFIGAIVAVAVMILLPNAGSFGLAVSAAMVFGLLMLMLLDTSINMAMQPFKMMVGDIVNEKQKGFAYSIQSFLCNAGSLLGYFFPIAFTALGIANIAPEGVVPDSVKWSFYIGAAILIICVIYTICLVREMPPKLYNEYLDESQESRTKSQDVNKSEGSKWGVFFQLGLVQLFCWVAFMYMWTYTNGAIADIAWGVDTNAAGASSSALYQEAGNWVGVLFAVQAIGSILWALCIPLFKQKLKLAYIVSLLIGAVGFISVKFVPEICGFIGVDVLATGKCILFGSYFLIGTAWAAMLALPFTILTNAIQGTKKMGTFLGLFNCTICIPQIIAALLGGVLLKYVAGDSQPVMLLIAGVCLVLGAASVFVVKIKKNE